MKKISILSFFTLLFLSNIAMAAPAVSGATGGECPPGQICNPLKYDTFQEIVGAISIFIYQIAIVLAPLMLIIAGFFYVTSAGDPKRVQTAKTIIIYTLIGLAIVLLASGLIAVLKSIIGVEGS